MLDSVSTGKVVVRQIEALDVTASTESPYNIEVTLQGGTDLKVFPVTVLRKASAETNYFNAVIGTHCDIEYINSTQAVVHVYANGSYKINY